jgi:predicted  nucleic acid-binding Zn-ribbon protein
MFNWFNRVVKDYYKPETYELLVTDTNGDKHSLAGLCASLAKEVVKLSSFTLKLQERITKLEAENVEMTNCLYAVENRLQAKIDNIHPVTYNIKNDNWHQ